MDEFCDPEYIGKERIDKLRAEAGSETETITITAHHSCDRFTLGLGFSFKPHSGLAVSKVSLYPSHAHTHTEAHRNPTHLQVPSPLPAQIYNQRHSVRGLSMRP